MALNIGSRLREGRRAAGMTQQQLAEAIGVSNTSVSNWEKGVSSPDPETIDKLCGVLGVQPNFFFDQPQAPITLDDFTYAMHGFSGDLTEENKATLLQMTQQLAEANRRKAYGETD